MENTQRRLDLEQQLELERLCSSFEESLKSDKPARTIESYLSSASKVPPAIVFEHLILLELQAVVQRGATADRSDYADRFPEFQNIVHQAFDEFKAESSMPQASPQESTVKEWTFDPGVLLAKRYRIESIVGRGGMGEVYVAEDLVLGQSVAVKLLPRELARQPKRRDYFLNEVRVARQVSHPNVCRVHDVADHNGQLFLTMEYINGENLHTLLSRSDGFSLDQVIELASQMSAGLAAAHAKGVVHRDLKPANLLVDDNGRVHIVDFGLAALSYSLDGSKSLVGTPAYMAPELLRGKPASIQSDIYSCGLIIRELVDTDSPETDVTSSRFERFERIIARATAHDPSDRFQRIEDLRTALSELQGDSTERNARPKRFGPRDALLLGVLFAASVATLATQGLWRRETDMSLLELVESIEISPERTISRNFPPPNTVGAPVVSPDEMSVVFVASLTDGKRNVYRQLIESDVPLPPLTSSGRASSPIWTPKGERILFLEYDNPSPFASRAQIRSMLTDGSSDEPIYPEGDAKIATMSAIYHSLECGVDSANTNFILFSEQNDNGITALTMLSNPDGNWGAGNWEKRYLTSGKWSDYGGRLSPNCEHIAFIRQHHGAESIYVMPLRGGTPTLVFHDWERIGSLTWFSDRHVVFSSEQSGRRALYVANVFNTQDPPVRLPFGADASGVSIRGEQVVYATFEGKFAIWQMEQADGAWKRTEFMPNEASQSSAWLTHDNDGRLVALFTRQLDGRRTIFRWAQGDRLPTALTNELPGHAGSPRSLDGEQIAFDWRQEETHFKSAIYLVDRHSKKPERVTMGRHEIRPHWSTDGEWLYFGSNRDGVFQVYRVRLKDGNEQQLTFAKNGGFITGQEAGDVIYLARETRGIWWIPKMNHELRHDPQPLSKSTASAGRFVVHGHKIYFYDIAMRQFNVYDVNTQDVSNVVDLEDPTVMTWFGISRDAKTIFYVDFEPTRTKLLHLSMSLPNALRP